MGGRAGAPCAAARTRYVEALTAPLRERLRLGTPVARVERLPGHVEVTPTGGSGPERFDELILAGHSDQSLALLADPSPAEAELLGAIPYQPNDVVLHTDASLLPRRRRAWASWNFHLQDEPAERTTVTYHMNRLQSLDAEQEFCVTLNRREAIDPAQVIESARVRPPRVHARRPGGAAALAPRSAACAARTTAARTGATASTRTGCRAPCASARASGREL